MVQAFNQLHFLKMYVFCCKACSFRFAMIKMMIDDADDDDDSHLNIVILTSCQPTQTLLEPNSAMLLNLGLGWD